MTALAKSPLTGAFVGVAGLTLAAALPTAVDARRAARRARRLPGTPRDGRLSALLAELESLGDRAPDGSA